MSFANSGVRVVSRSEIKGYKNGIIDIIPAKVNSGLLVIGGSFDIPTSSGKDVYMETVALMKGMILSEDLYTANVNGAGERALFEFNALIPGPGYKVQLECMTISANSPSSTGCDFFYDVVQFA